MPPKLRRQHPRAKRRCWRSRIYDNGPCLPVNPVNGAIDDYPDYGTTLTDTPSPSISDGSAHDSAPGLPTDAEAPGAAPADDKFSFKYDANWSTPSVIEGPMLLTGGLMYDPGPTAPSESVPPADVPADPAKPKDEDRPLQN